MNGAAEPRTTQGDGTVLRVVYGALVAGVLVFAAVARLLVGPVGAFEELPVRLVWLTAAAACVFAAGLFRTRLARASERPSPGPALVVWSLAEGQALLGIVGYLLTGDVIVFWAALAAFAYLFARYRPTVFVTRPHR